MINRSIPKDFEYLKLGTPVKLWKDPLYKSFIYIGDHLSIGIDHYPNIFHRFMYKVLLGRNIKKS